MKSSPQTARVKPVLEWSQESVFQAGLSPVEFLLGAATALRENCTLAQVLETCAYYAAPGDPVIAGVLSKYLGTRRQEWAVTSAAIRGLASLGGSAESILGQYLGEVRSETERIDATVEALKEKHAKLPNRLLLRRSYLGKLEAAVVQAQQAVVARMEGADGFSLIAERLLDLRDGKHPLPILGRIGSKTRRSLQFRRRSAADGLLLELVRVLDAAEHRKTLELLVNRSDLRGYGYAALEKLNPDLTDEEFVRIVREPWLTLKLRGYDRARLLKLLEGRGEHGAQLIKEAFAQARRAAVKAQLVPAVVKNLPIHEQWAFYESLYRDPKAEPKLKETALREMQRLKLPQGAELFLQILCHPNSTGAELKIASSALRELGTSVFFRVLVEEGALGRAVQSARSRKVQHRLALLRRQLGNPELQEAFPEVAKPKRKAASKSRVSCQSVPLQAGFTGNPIIPAASASVGSSRFERARPRAAQPLTNGSKAIAWNMVLTSRRNVVRAVKSVSMRAAASIARSFALGSASLLPSNCRWGSVHVVCEAIRRVFAGIRSQAEKLRFALSAGACAEKLRFCPDDAEVVAWT